MQSGSLAEDQVYNSDLERTGPKNLPEFEEKDELIEDPWSL